MCKCNRENFEVRLYKHHHSNGNGTTSWHPIVSDWSFLHCLKCGDAWRTKAKYIKSLPGAGACRCYQKQD